MTTTQHQYNGFAQNESLSSVLDQHVNGITNELEEYDSEQTLNKVRFVSLVTVGDNDHVINKSYTNITKSQLLDDIRNELEAIWEPGYESDVKVGAGSTIKITD